MAQVTAGPSGLTHSSTDLVLVHVLAMIWDVAGSWTRSLTPSKARAKPALPAGVAEGWGVQVGVKVAVGVGLGGTGVFVAVGPTGVQVGVKVAVGVGLGGAGVPLGVKVGVGSGVPKASETTH